MTKRNQQFGNLLKAGLSSLGHVQGKTQQAVEDQVGDLIGVAGTTLQRYKAGHVPPESGRVAQLARLCVRDGLLGRVWAERFLEAAHYPPAEGRALLAEIFPPAAPTGRAPAPTSILPTPTYSQFVMRPEAYAAVVAGLQSDLPATLIVSLGGMGKTSLARAIVGDCLDARPGLPRFTAAIWLSDKDQPGTTHFSLTLDAIARALDFPGLVTQPFRERIVAVEGLLRAQPVLLVIDNAETIADTALLSWLAQLPAPSKALVTSRADLAALSPSYLVALGPLADAEARSLIAAWLQRSRLRHLHGALDQLQPIVAATGGNPKAIELALGLIQHRPHEQVVADLVEARLELFDDLFNDLFTRAWDLLDTAAQRVLLALPLFPVSASAEAIAYCVDLSSAAFQRAVEQLERLALLNAERHDILSSPRYNAHPLVRAFARVRFAERPETEQTTRYRRWLTWCHDLATAVGFCWDDLDRLDLLDDEHETIQAAIRWSAEHQDDRLTLALVEGVRYYYNVRGFWGDVELHNNELRAIAARRLHDRDNAILALAHHTEILSKQGRLEEADAAMARLQAIGERAFRERLEQVEVSIGAARPPRRSISDDAAFEYGHALGLYARAQGRLDKAEAHWRLLQPFAAALGGQKYVVSRRWLATVLLQQARHEEARALLAESLTDARGINDTRSVTGNTLKLAMIDIRQGRLDQAQAALDECRLVATRHRDRRRLAECARLSAELALHRGNMVDAANEITYARDLFERLGMRHEAAELRQLEAEMRS